jgi:basic membrane protein A
MRTRFIGNALALVVGFALVASACGSDATTAPPEPFHVAFMLLGSASDGGWNLSHDLGRRAVEAEFGEKVVTTLKEGIPESPQVLQVIDDLVVDGAQMIFGTSFGYMDFMLEAAEKYPDVIFEHATGYKTAPNMANYTGAQEDSKYLAGIAAGAAAENGKLGYVAPFAIPLIIKAVNAWALGAQSVNPDATVEVVWLNSWFDPAAERQAAESLIADGAQVVGHSQDTPSACQAAEAAGVFCTGNTIYQGDFTPNAWLTGDVINWGQYVVQRVGEALAGTWETGSFYGTMSNGVMEIAPFGQAVDAETRTLIETTRDGIADGSFAYFVGPISDQSGELRVPEGEKMSFEEIVTMDWFVEGILGSPSG